MSLITTRGKLYFKLKQGSFKASDVVAFLSDMLKRFKRKKLMIIWDGVRIHNNQKVKDFHRTKAKGRIHLVRLPPYSPQLNADEKQVQHSYEKLSDKPKTIANFFKHKEAGFYSQ